MISIKNFVNANIEIESSPVSFSGFRTTIYFANVEIGVPDVSGGNFATISSSSDFSSKVTNANEAVVQSVNEYFKNGGTRLCIVAPSVFTLDGFKSDMLNVGNVVDDYFFVVFSAGLVGTQDGYTTTEVFNIANFCSGNGWSDSDLKYLNTMRPCFTTNVSTFVTSYNLLNTLSVVKYSTYALSGDLVDAALLVGAYFSKIDTNASDKILDYNFTKEILGSNHFEDLTQNGFEDLTNSASTGYYNVICNVANNIVNVGGDYCSKDGVSISLDFGTSCIERDLNYANIQLLFGKLPLNAEGQSKLIDAIRYQLTKYVDSEFLESEATYTGKDKKVTYNGKSYTVVKSGDILPSGYKIFYVPINAISAADKSDKRFPYIYVVLQSVHGARMIEVNGSIV